MKPAHTLSAAAFLVLTGCATSRVVRPDWIDNRPLEAESYIGVGFARVVDGRSEQAHDDADEHARNKLAAEIRVSISRELNRFVNNVSTDRRSMLLEEYSEKSAAIVYEVVEGAQIASRWFDEDRLEWHALARLPKETFRRHLEERLTARESAARELRGAMREALLNLSQALMTPGSRVVVQNFTFQDDGLPSPLGRYLESLITECILNEHLFALYPRSHFDALVSSTGRTFGARAGVPVDFVLSGVYFVDSDGMTLFLRVLEASSGTARAMRSLRIDRDALPSGIDHRPPEGSEATRAAMAQTIPGVSDVELQLEMFLNKGAGASYRVGEHLVVGVRPSRDCYLKIFMTSASGRTTLIFPNRYAQDNRLEAGKVRLLGGTQDSFQIVVTQPTGLEVLKAVASGRQFTDHDLLIEKFRARQDFDQIDDATQAAVRAFIRRGLVMPLAPNTPGAVAEATSVYSVYE